MRFCRDCRHMVQEVKAMGTVTYHRCAVSPNLVTGEPIHCDDARRDSALCGESGSKYEPLYRVAAMARRSA
jgi:5-enolpyruvylshikimate-3-phosphate synthase